MNELYENRINILISYLKSGKYKKTNTGYMRIEDEFDMYGVICEAYKDITGIGSWEKDGSIFKFGIPNSYKEW